MFRSSRPIYEDFVRAVRAVNASVPRERQLRVLLGDLPVDWDAARRNPPKPGERRLFGQPVQNSIDGAQNLSDLSLLAPGGRSLPWSCACLTL